jgi:hypothetical protein
LTGDEYLELYNRRVHGGIENGGAVKVEVGIPTWTPAKHLEPEDAVLAIHDDDDKILWTAQSPVDTRTGSRSTTLLVDQVTHRTARAPTAHPLAASGRRRAESALGDQRLQAGRPLDWDDARDRLSVVGDRQDSAGADLCQVATSPSPSSWMPISIKSSEVSSYCDDDSTFYRHQPLRSGRKLEGRGREPMAATCEHDGWVPVPPNTAGAEELMEFALTYNAYAVHDDLSKVAEISEAVHARFNESAVFDARLDDLRATLFFKQRAHRHGGWGRFTDDPVVFALLQRIRELSGGSVSRVPPAGDSA